ncbi:zeaxanthin epoxidase, chloroplastic [Benincasa hispida]|uniref:zeaxanthin epoxidase, chloroplastic n=1 Tax=Benincasa hispida TaxID=102211 RepID=UPI0018FF7FB9|nr:zeaxanthin epoxidase, chloroplastic [Benincasa hispida]
MELALHSLLSFSNYSSPPCISLTPSLHVSRPSSFSFHFRPRPRSLLQPLQASRWLLLPVGDGEWKHIGSKVEMPDAFEIVSNEVTVGRLPDKADIVIPVATVSALHARIKNQEDRLLVIDLDSTNGTFIDDKRLNPGVVAAVSSGNCITFGDIHLAMFQVSKLKTVEAATKIQEESEEPISDSETS